MIGFEIGTRTGEELVRFVRALGQHRYVASRLHLVHVFAIAAAAEAHADAGHPALAEAGPWAKRVLGAAGAVDLASKDERLFRRATDAEVVAVLETFWGSGDASTTAKQRLSELLASIDAAPANDSAPGPFDESREEDVFPVLIDAGWELLPLAQLDFERHKGAIQSFDDFEVARFEEENAVPPVANLYELPAIGGVELLAALDANGTARAPFVLWHQGNETYLDYVLRGVVRASKITLDED